MRKHLGGWRLAIVCVLLSGHLSMVKARGIKHRIKWNRKAAPGAAQVTEARVAEQRPGAFVRQGRRLDIDFGAEGNRYYEANYWQLPDGILYDGCAEANVTKEALVAGCVNATQLANQAELAHEGQDTLHRRVLGRLIRELCALKRCKFWPDRAAGPRLVGGAPVFGGLLLLIWLLVR
ncbi:prion-like protein doppel [Dasypus novemcinctus]|uniref:prion-like protein doppel n=1 Tax=Dasypus novemcinctus TaxID=9361 RepID=UPI000328B286|nr:prion-like protein doppel [Dasypus novemcinctus]